MVGIILVAVGIFLCWRFGLFCRISNSAPGEGRIIGTTNTDHSPHSVTIKFYVKGIPYIFRSKYRFIRYRVGNQIRVAYNSHNPEEAMIRPHPMVCFAISVILGLNTASTISSLCCWFLC